jgi:hypothetical protein
MELLIILATLYLGNKLSITIYRYYQLIRQQIKQRQLRQTLIANHPEMKGVSIDDEDLFFFATDREFKSMIMNNNEEGESIAIEDNDKFSIAIVEADDDDEEFDSV